MKRKLGALLALLALLLLAVTAVPAFGNPFVEYQDVPVYDNNYGGWCIQRTTWVTQPNGNTTVTVQLIC